MEAICEICKKQVDIGNAGGRFITISSCPDCNSGVVVSKNEKIIHLQ